MKIGVAYETSASKLRSISEIIKNVVSAVEGVRFDRAFFNTFGDFALIYEVVYFVENSDYLTYLKANQEILLRLKEKFEEEKIEIAYPTQKIYLEQAEVK